MRIHISLALFVVSISQEPNNRPTNPPTHQQYQAANYTFIINWYKWDNSSDTDPCVSDNFIDSEPHFQELFSDVTKNTKENKCKKVCHDKDNCSDSDQSHIADYRLIVEGYHPTHWYDRVVNRTLAIYPNAGFDEGNYHYYGPPGTCSASKPEPRWEQDIPCNFGPPRIQCSAHMHPWVADWPYAFAVEDDLGCHYTMPPSHNPTSPPTNPGEAGGGGWGTAAIVVCSLLAMCGLGAWFWRSKKSGSYANIDTDSKVPGPNGTMVFQNGDI